MTKPRNFIFGLIVLLIIVNVGFLLFSSDDLDRMNRVNGFMSEAFAAQNAGNYADAIQDFTRALNLAGEDKRIYYNRGVAYFLDDQSDAARADLNQAVALDANYALPYLVLGDLEAAAGNAQLAQAHYERYRTLIDDDPDALATVDARLEALP